jgi:hypothetical protein
MEKVAEACENERMMPRAWRSWANFKSNRADCYVAEILVKSAAVYLVFFPFSHLKDIVNTLKNLDLASVRPWDHIKFAVYENVSHFLEDDSEFMFLRRSLSRGVEPPILKLIEN